MLHNVLHHFLSDYGYWALALMIGLESMGLPLPGETILVTASLHAGHRGESIAPVIAAAVAGAIIGDNIGYYLGASSAFGFYSALAATSASRTIASSSGSTSS